MDIFWVSELQLFCRKALMPELSLAFLVRIGSD